MAVRIHHWETNPRSFGINRGRFIPNLQQKRYISQAFSLIFESFCELFEGHPL